MQYEKYVDVGKQPTSINSRPSIAFHFYNENARTDIWTNASLEYPWVSSSFNLSPCNVDIKLSFDEVSRLAIRPNLKRYNTELEFLPLENASFKVGVFNYFETIKSRVKLEYTSATKETKIIVSPKFEFKNGKFDAEFTLNNIEKDRLPFHVERLDFLYKNISIYSRLDQKYREALTGMFVNLKKVNVGLLFLLGDVNTCFLDPAFYDADFMVRTKICGIKLSAIKTFYADHRLKVNMEMKNKKSGVMFGAKTEFTRYVFRFVTGIEAPIKQANMKLVFDGEHIAVFNGNVKAQIKFPFKPCGEAAIGVSLNDIPELNRFGYNFDITFNQ